MHRLARGEVPGGGVRRIIEPLDGFEDGEPRLLADVAFLVDDSRDGHRRHARSARDILDRQRAPAAAAWLGHLPHRSPVLAAVRAIATKQRRLMVALSSLGEGLMKLNVRALAVIAIAGFVSSAVPIMAQPAPATAPLYKDPRPADPHSRRGPASANDARRESCPAADRMGAQGQDPDTRRHVLADKRVAELPQRHRPDRPPLRPARRDPEQRRRRCRRPAPMAAVRARRPNISTPRSIGRWSIRGSASRS